MKDSFNDSSVPKQRSRPSIWQPARSAVLQAWITTLRLRTLLLSMIGITTGSVLAHLHTQVSSGIVFFALLTAIALQLLANLANDYGDFGKTADTPARLGPIRGMQMGLITPVQMQIAILAVGVLAILSGIVLIGLASRSISEWLCFAGLGILCILAALTYTLGRHAYGYKGLGDVSVLIFFGWISVIGSYYLQTHRIDGAIIVPATACGLMGALVLNLNNMRDMREDFESGKITIAVRLGPHRVRLYHLALLALSLLFMVWSAMLYGGSRPWVWLCLLSLPLFYQNTIAILYYREPGQLRSQLGVVIAIALIGMGCFDAGLLIP